MQKLASVVNLARAFFVRDEHLGLAAPKKREKKRKKLPRIDDDAKLSRRVLMDKMDDGLDDTRLTIAIAAVGYLFAPFVFEISLRRVKKAPLYSHSNFLSGISTTGSQVKTSDLRSQSRTEPQICSRAAKAAVGELENRQGHRRCAEQDCAIKSVRLAICSHLDRHSSKPVEIA